MGFAEKGPSPTSQKAMLVVLTVGRVWPECHLPPGLSLGQSSGWAHTWDTAFFPGTAGQRSSGSVRTETGARQPVFTQAGWTRQLGSLLFT